MTQPVPIHVLHGPGYFGGPGVALRRTDVVALNPFDAYDPGGVEAPVFGVFAVASNALTVIVAQYDNPAERDEYVRTDPDSLLA